MILQSVSVKQLPEKIDAKHRRMFMREFEGCLDGHRPCIVIDCSNARYMDRHALLLLLCCLEEAMKRHGDVRLATVSAQGQSLLSATNIGCLFTIFDQVADAVKSYRRSSTFVLEPSRVKAQQLTADAA